MKPKNILDFPKNDGLADPNHNASLRMVREWLIQNPDWLIRRKIRAAWAGLLAAALLDMGLMLNAQYQSFTDSMGEFTGSPLACMAVSCMSLAVFWTAGISWHSKWVYGRPLAVGIYALLLVLLMARLSSTYGDLLADLWSSGGNVFNADNGGVPAFVSWLGVLLMALLYSVGGWLFLVAKHSLNQGYYLKQCALEAQSRLALEQNRVKNIETATALRELCGHLEHQPNVLALVNEALTVGREAALAVLSAECQAAEITSHDLLASHEQVMAAKNKVVRLEAIGQALKSCAVVLLLAVAVRPAHADTAEILRTAPSIQLFLDLSRGSPATSVEFIKATFPILSELLSTQPLGTLVEVRGIGEADLPAVSFRARIQAKKTAQGDTLAGVERNLKGLLVSLAEKSLGHEFNQSELIGAFFDASRNLNRQAAAQSAIILYSDGIENSSYAQCHKIVACKFPKPKFSLDGAHVYLLGVGQNMDSKDAQALTLKWQDFLEKAGGSVEMTRRD